MSLKSSPRNSNVSDTKRAVCSLLLLRILKIALPPPVQKELSDRPCRGPSLRVIYRLCKEKACPAEAVLTVQTGDDWSFKLRSSLKSARFLPRRQHMQTSVHKTRSNFGGCHNLGNYPRCPCRQAVTTRK